MSDEDNLLKLINKNMRHDILNNLATIRSILEIYQDSKDKNLLNKAYYQVERSVEFLKRMKEVESLLPDSKLKFLRVSEALENVIDDHEVECNVQGDCKVIADEALGAVFKNLIENAVIHGGADRVDVSIQNRGKTCQIKIADNGQGIPEDMKENIFEEGFSGGRGTGLGLYIIKKTIERYGGTIHVENNSQIHSHGTTFVLTLYNQFGLDDSALDVSDQKWAEKKLRESEEKYRNFFQTSRDAVFISSKEGNWIDMNDATVELFGYGSKEELMKVKVPYIYAEPTDREEHLRAIEQWGFIKEYPVNLRKKDGSIINSLITSVPVRDECGVVIGFQGTIRDITEQKQMEESYRTLVESAGDKIYVVDNDLRFLHANTKYLERIGATKGIVGKHYGDFHSEKGTRKFQKRVNEVRRQRKPFTYEYKSDRDGRYFLRTLTPQINQETGEIDGITVISKDITEKKKVEERLKESEEKYRSLFENSPIVVWEEDFSDFKDYVDNLKERVEDLETFLDENPEEVMKCFEMIKIIDVNKAALDHYGAKSKEELIQKLDNLVCKQTYRSLKNEIMAIAEGKTYFRMETVAKTLDGKERDELLELRVPEEYQDDFSRVYVTAIDITDQKWAEKKLRESEEKYRTLFESSIDGIAESDLEGNIINCNQAYMDITGYTIERIKNLRYQDLTPEKWKELDEEQVRKAVDRGYSDVYEKECMREDGAVTPISIRVWLEKDKQGRPIGLWRIVRDITARKRGEKRLKESEERYRATFEFTGTAMIIVEEDTTLSNVNTKFEEISGYTKEEVEGKISWMEIVHPDDVKKMKKYHQARRRKEYAPNKYEFRFVDKKGSVKSALLHIGLIPGTKKSVASVIDITYLKRLNILLEVISDINELVAKEKNPGGVMNTVCSKLSNLYKAVFTSLIRNKELIPVRSEGIYMQSLRKTINQCPSIIKAMNGELMKVATDSDLCKHCTKEEHNYALSIPLTHEKQHGVITIHSISDFSEEEIILLQKLASNVGFALFAYEVEESEKRAIEQLQNNFMQFEKTADRLRNPLAIIMSFLELTDHYKECEIIEIVNEQTERIKEELDNLRREEILTFELVEKFREYKK